MQVFHLRARKHIFILFGIPNLWLYVYMWSFGLPAVLGGQLRLLMSQLLQDPRPVLIKYLSNCVENGEPNKSITFHSLSGWGHKNFCKP